MQHCDLAPGERDQLRFHEALPVLNHSRRDHWRDLAGRLSSVERAGSGSPSAEDAGENAAKGYAMFDLHVETVLASIPGKGQVGGG